MYQCVPLCVVMCCHVVVNILWLCSVIYLESVMFKGDCMGVILHQVSQGSDTCKFVFHKMHDILATYSRIRKLLLAC